MEGCHCQCFSPPPPGFVLHIPLVWVVRALMLGSMQLQLFLVVFGALRYRSSSSLLRFVVWGAYLAADAVAISALGIMTHSIRNGVYGLWAPILLIHLGGPDTITAYSTADNELWRRHFFIMIYQVSVAAYVIYLSRLQGHLLAASIFLFVAGTTKYAERTYALRSASNTHMVNSTQALYMLMQSEGERDPVGYHYVVMGEQTLSNKEFRNIADSSVSETFVRETAIVTVKKVFEQEGRQITDKYILCLSHALFKMYKRRFVSLFFHEGVLKKTRRFFISEGLSCEELFKAIELELKFMYDVLFSKSSSTAFRKRVILLRIFNTCLLVAAGGLVIFQLTKKPAHKTVTFVIISVALAVEIIQLCRIALSDWTMVRLICVHIKHFSRPRHGDWYTVQVIQFLISLLGIARKPFGNKCWRDKLNQYHMIDSRGKYFRGMWKIARFAWLRRNPVLFYITVSHTTELDVPIDLKSFIFEIVKDKCSPEQDIQICRDRVYDPDEGLITKNCEDLLDEVSGLQLEDGILVWHIATSICEHSDRDADPAKLEVASMLSRYFAYLLVVHPNLLPLHPDIALLTYVDVLDQIIKYMPKDVSDWTMDNEKVKGFAISYSNKNVDLSIRLAEKLKKRAMNERWDIIAQHWGETLIYVAAYNKAPLHVECIAAGGEFLSQVWALLGHLGCGEQSDTAVTKRKDDKRIEEAYIRQKKNEEKLRKTRAKEVKRRIEEEKKRTLQEIEEERREEYQSTENEAEKEKKLEERLKSIIEEDEKYKKPQD